MTQELDALLDDDSYPVDCTCVHNIVVSTVFLGTKHKDDNPLLFETATFDDRDNGIKLRCATHEEAQSQRVRVVDMILASKGETVEELLDRVRRGFS